MSSTDSGAREVGTKMDAKGLAELAAIDIESIGPHESNVKFHIIIPFLQCFDHQHLDLEHAAQGSRIDININNRIPDK